MNTLSEALNALTKEQADLLADQLHDYLTKEAPPEVQDRYTSFMKRQERLITQSELLGSFDFLEFFLVPAPSDWGVEWYDEAGRLTYDEKLVKQKCKTEIKRERLAKDEKDFNTIYQRERLKNPAGEETIFNEWLIRHVSRGLKHDEEMAKYEKNYEDLDCRTAARNFIQWVQAKSGVTTPAITANELRIGNYLRLVGESWTKQRDTIQAITAQDILDIEGGADGYEAVELTPEILGKCGFVHVVDTDEGPHFAYEGLQLWYSADLPNEATGFYHINSKLLVHVDYLHQLQNFYHSLSGEELKS